jgi:H+-translocating diphosphatase
MFFKVLVISTVLETPVLILLAKYCLPTGEFNIADNAMGLTWFHVVTPALVGAWAGLIIGFVTEYYTSHSYRPVQEISETQRVAAATGIIYGLALGYLSCVVPVFCLGITVLVAHQMCGFYGVAIGSLGKS